MCREKWWRSCSRDPPQAPPRRILDFAPGPWPRLRGTGMTKLECSERCASWDFGLRILSSFGIGRSDLTKAVQITTPKMRSGETLALTPAPLPQEPPREGEARPVPGIFAPFGVASLHWDLRRSARGDNHCPCAFFEPGQ